MLDVTAIQFQNEAMRFVETKKSQHKVITSVAHSMLTIMVLAGLFALITGVILHYHPKGINYFDNSSGGLDIIPTYYSKKMVLTISFSLFAGFTTVGSIVIFLACKRDIKLYLRRSTPDYGVPILNRNTRGEALHENMKVATIISGSCLGLLQMVISLVVIGILIKQTNKISHIQIQNKELIALLQEKATKLHSLHYIFPKDWRYYLPGCYFGKVITSLNPPFQLGSYASIFVCRTALQGMQVFIGLGGILFMMLSSLFSVALMGGMKNYSRERRREWLDLPDGVTSNPHLATHLQAALDQRDRSSLVDQLNAFGKDALRKLLQFHKISEGMAQEIYDLLRQPQQASKEEFSEALFERTPLPQALIDLAAGYYS